MRRAGASYEEIARAGGGIASTVAKTAAASDEELLGQSRLRLHALMRGGCTTIEAKSGYGLDPKSELRLLKIASELGKSEAVRIVPTLLALHALPADQKDRRAHYVSEIVDKLIPAAAKQGLATSVDAYCDTIAFTPDEVERLFKAAAHHGLRVRLHAEQLSNQHGAALAAQYRALSADHLEHLDEAGAKAMAAAGTVAVLLPGAYYALQEDKKPPVALLRKHKVPMAVATDCNPGTSPLLSPTLAMNMACTLFGLTPEEALAGMTTNAARALGLAHSIGSIATGKQADLCVWRIENLAELGYWIGLPGPERRIFGGRMRNLAAALVAIMCWVGLAIQFANTFGNQHHQVATTLWVLVALLHRAYQPARRAGYDLGRDGPPRLAGTARRSDPVDHPRRRGLL